MIYAKKHAELILDHINKMMRRYQNAGNSEDRREIEDQIFELPIFILVRPGFRIDWDEPEFQQYEISFRTVYPVVLIAGKLGEHYEPETARLKFKDFNTPWFDYPIDDDELLEFTRVFRFDR